MCSCRAGLVRQRGVRDAGGSVWQVPFVRAWVSLVIAAAVVTAGAIGVAGPAASTSSGELAASTRWTTKFFISDSKKPGPTVLVVAGIHGDERAPPLAASRIRRWQPSRGKLVVVPEANRPALASGTRHSPRTKHPDLNRNFPTKWRAKPRGELASALWRLTTDLTPDWVLDLHEGWGFNRRNKKTMGSSIVVVPDDRVTGRTTPMAKHLLANINSSIEQRTKHFTKIAPGPLGSFARSVTEQLGIPSFVFETTRLTQPIELRASQHERLVLTTLTRLGMKPVESKRRQE